MGLLVVGVLMTVSLMISYLIPYKFDSEIASVLYHGYKELEFEDAVL